MKNSIWLLCLLAFGAVNANAQEEDNTNDNKVSVTGSIQSDVLVPQEDLKIGSPKYKEKVLTNTFLDLNLISKNVDAGARFEFLRFPLPGFEQDYRGYGVPYFYLKGKFEKLEVTLGTYYEQFGSGFILRTYEERSLGIDNSLLGARVVYKPYKGIVMKGITGEQRRYWAHNNSWINGVDLELNLGEWFNGLQKRDTRIMLGGSFVNKYENNKEDKIMVDRTHMLNLPQNVNAWDARIQLQKGGF